MNRIALLAGALALSPLFGAPTASAAVPIPCTSTKFIAAAPVKDVKGATGGPIIPHYLVFGCGGAKWDGYQSPGGKYNPLTPAILAALPPVPGFWVSAWNEPRKFWAEWLWIVVGSIATLGYLLTVLGNLAARSSPDGAAPGGANLSR